MKLKSFTAFLLLAFLASCSGSDKAKNESAKEDNVPTVKVEQVSEQDVDQIQTYTATVEPYLINNISAQMSNRIKAIYVNEGMRVSKGQKLVVLDNVNTDSYQLQISTAQAQLSQLEADLNRAKELYRIGGGTRQQVEQMQTQVTAARNQLATARRALRNAQENTVLTSPINGVVTARNYDPGDVTGQLPVLTIGRVQPVKVVINVAETEYAKFRKGMPAVMTFDTYGDRKFTGVVSLIAPTVDTNTKTFGVEITLPNADGAVLPGMFARVTLNFGTARHVVVPDKAVVKMQGSGNSYVYTYSDGEVHYVQVQLGRRIDNSYELLSGVESGAYVVVTGQSRLANGIKVKLAK